MIQEIALAKVLGMRVLLISGLAAGLFFLITLAAGYLIFSGKLKAPITLHRNLAILALAIVIIHAVLAASVFIFRF